MGLNLELRTTLKTSEHCYFKGEQGSNFMDAVMTDAKFRDPQNLRLFTFKEKYDVVLDRKTGLELPLVRYSGVRLEILIRIMFRFYSMSLGLLETVLGLF